MVRGQEAVGKKREPRKIFWISHLSRRGVGRDARGAPLVLERPRQRERRIRCNVIVSNRCARPTSSQLARVSASWWRTSKISRRCARATDGPRWPRSQFSIGAVSDPRANPHGRVRSPHPSAPEVISTSTSRHESVALRLPRIGREAPEVAPPNHPRRRRLEDRIARCRGRRLDARRPGCTPRAPARPLP